MLLIRQRILDQAMESFSRFARVASVRFLPIHPAEAGGGLQSGWGDEFVLKMSGKINERSAVERGRPAVGNPGGER